MYFGTVFLGYRGYPVDVVLLTGESFSRILCYPCHPCFQYEHPDGIFVPNTSRSYEKVSCVDNIDCDTLQGNCDDDEKCKFNFLNGDRYTRGDLSEDKLRFKSGKRIVNHNFTFGCIHEAKGAINEPAKGTFGLGGHYLSVPNQIGDGSFSFCLPDFKNKRGWVDFGVAVKAPGPEAITTSLVEGFNRNLYYVKILSFTVEGCEPIFINHGRGNFSVDTGEPKSFVDAHTLSRLKDCIDVVVPYPEVESIPGYDLCFDATIDRGKGLRLPWIDVMFFIGGSIKLSYTHIFFKHNDDTWCFTFTAGEQSIFGNQLLIGGPIVVDPINQRISFDKKKGCR